MIYQLNLKGLNLILKFGIKYEFDGVGYCIWVVAESFGKRGGNIGDFSDILEQSEFSENMLHSNLYATFSTYRNTFLDHKKAVCELSMPDAESGNKDFSFS